MSSEEQIISKDKYPGIFSRQMGAILFISGHIFAPNGGYFVYYPLNILRNKRGFVT